MIHQAGESRQTEANFRRLAAIECWLGAGGLLVGAVVAALWRSGNPSSAPHGGLVLLATASVFIFGGTALLVAGALLRRADHWRWTGHALLLALFITVLIAPQVIAWSTFVLAQLFGPST